MNIIEVQGLTKSFDRLNVLQKVNLTVEEGECLAIIGASGCGKSLFLRLLAMLEKPDEGHIAIAGQEITAPGADIQQIRRLMGMVYQKFHLFSHLDVMDNLCLAPQKVLGMEREAAEERAHNLLEKVGLTAKSHAFINELSGGQQQRIAICRSLMMQPRILLCDEPTSALDPSMVGEVLATIRMLSKQDLTMLFVTHEMKFARNVADRVLFFADGGIYEQGTPEAIFDRPQRKKTIAFVRRLKYFHYEVKQTDFDFVAMQVGIQMFSEKYGIDDISIKLQLCAEETVGAFLHGLRGTGDPIDITVDIEYGEQDRRVVADIGSRGAPLNPLAEQETTDEEETLYWNMVQGILKGISASQRYSYAEGRNKIRFEFSSHGYNEE